MKVLVIAPHPDDEVLGCGGTIKKHAKKGDEVYLCIITAAYTPDWTEEFIEKRKEEIEESRKVLGISGTSFLNLPTVKLDTIPQKKINDLIAKKIDEVRPEILYIPFEGDINKDHQIIHNASMLAVRYRIGSFIKKVLCYEVLSETEWGSIPFTPNSYINVSDTLDFKLKAMSCYGSELKEYPHGRSLEAVKALAQKRGIESGLKFAEAFKIIKEIN